MSDDQVRSIIERVQRLQEEKKTIEDDIKEVYAEARGNGFDVKALRAVVKHLGKDPDEVTEFEAIFDLYLQAYHQASPAVPSRARVARDADARTRRNTGHQPARPLAERDPQSAQHGSDSEGGAGGESRSFTAGSEQGSASEPQARNEPGNDLAASGGEGRQPLPETPANSQTPAGAGPFAGRQGDVPSEPAGEPVIRNSAPAVRSFRHQDSRPHCRKPDACGSATLDHCFVCKEAIVGADNADGASDRLRAVGEPA